MSANKNRRRIVTDAPLRDVAVFSLPISLWSGRGKLVVDDLGIDERLLPPEALASLGSKRLIAKEALKPLERVKRKMIRAIASTGVRFLSGYAHSHASAKKVGKVLDKLVKEGEATRAEFLANFEIAASEWQAEFPDWAHIISAALPSKESLAQRISFGYQCFVAGAPEDHDLAKHLQSEASGLAGSLWAEVEFEAMEFVKKSFAGQRNTANQRTIKPVYRMIEKLDGLSFLDHRIGPFVDVMEGVMSRFPKNGKVTDSLYLTLVRVGHILADRNAAQEIGEKVYAGMSVEDAVADIAGQSDGLSLSGESVVEDAEVLAAEVVLNAADSSIESCFDPEDSESDAPPSPPKANTGSVDRTPESVVATRVVPKAIEQLPFVINF